MDVLMNYVDKSLKTVPKFVEFSDYFWTKLPKIFENKRTKMPNFEKIGRPNMPKFASKFGRLGPSKIWSAVKWVRPKLYPLR